MSRNSYESGNDVEMTREELVEELSARVSDPVDIGRITTFVSNAFRLQNDIGRPAYIFEAEGTPTEADVSYLREVMSELGVCCALVPARMIKYVGKVTPESMSRGRS
mgnify:CR=1 FL=1